METRHMCVFRSCFFSVGPLCAKALMIAFLSLFEHDLLGFHFHSDNEFRISGLSVGGKVLGCRAHSDGLDPYFVMDLSLPLTWRAAQDEDDGDDDCGAFWNNSSQMPRLFMPLSLPRSPFTFHPSLIRPFFFLFFSAVSTRNGQDEERINNKEASCLLSHALVYIQPFQ